MTYDRLEGYKEQIKILESVFGVEAVGWEIPPNNSRFVSVSLEDTESGQCIGIQSHLSGYARRLDGGEGLPVALEFQFSVAERPEKLPLLFRQLMETDPVNNLKRGASTMKRILDRQEVDEYYQGMSEYYKEKQDV